MFTVSDTGPIGMHHERAGHLRLLLHRRLRLQESSTPRKGAVIGLTLGMYRLTVVMLLWNYLITPIYMGNGSARKSWSPC